MNRGRRERREIHTQAATPEFACFPHVEQIAQLYRHIGKHKPETVYLMTDFYAEMSAEHASPAMRFVTARYPSFRRRS